MSERVLSTRELNRATLARQMLLYREPLVVPAAIERLVGLQAQLALPPYIGLWSRLRDFQRGDLASMIENRTVVKGTFMRATLHLITANDFIRFRTTLQPMLSAASGSIAKRRGADGDFSNVLEAAKVYIAEKPRTFADISNMLAELMPGEDVGAMRYTVRLHLPLVQVPVAEGWSYPGKPSFTLAEAWIGRTVSEQDNLEDLVFRYLAAFGPASASDFQTWSGLAGKEVFEKLKPRLRSYRDEKRRELLDLPDVPLPSGDTPAPVRFLPEFDNLLLSHTNRARVIADEHRAKVFLPGLRVRGTILVDGFVRGAWRIEKAKDAATLLIEPFEALNNQDREALIGEGEALLRFVESKAKSVSVRFAS